MTNLIINYYTDKNKTRQDELNFCLKKNIENKLIDRVILIGFQHDLEKAINYITENLNEYQYKVRIVVNDVRPAYNHFFGVISGRYQHDINIISNTDIYFNETLQSAIDFDWGKEKTCMALSRWDLNIKPQMPAGVLQHFNTPDSQDAWIFKGEVPVIEGATFTMGMAGCDNKIAYLLAHAGYNVINPSKTIQAIHYHVSKVRNYNPIEDRKIIQPPYKTIHSSAL